MDHLYHKTLFQGWDPMKDLLTASNRCPYCNKSFSNTGNLNKHLKLHTGERPHKCSFCGRGFTENYKLRIHTKACKKLKMLTMAVQ